MKFMISKLSPYKWRMALGLAVKITATVAELFLPVILTYILDVVILSESIGKILLWGALMLLCALVACIFNITANRMAAHVSMLFSRELRRELFEKTLTLSASDTDRLQM